jgi:hypothetical protein
MRGGFKWLLAILFLALLVMMFGPALFGLFFGAGFDPS